MLFELTILHPIYQLAKDDVIFIDTKLMLQCLQRYFIMVLLVQYGMVDYSLWFILPSQIFIIFIDFTKLQIDSLWASRGHHEHRQLGV